MERILFLSGITALCLLASSPAGAQLVIQPTINVPPAVYAAPEPAYVAPPPVYFLPYPTYYDYHHQSHDWRYWHDHRAHELHDHHWRG